MKLHDRAWEGFRIVILAAEPLLPARIEQAIASAFPATEVQLSSFENYEQAYNYCKQHRDVGFFFVHESCGESSFISAFRELAALYTTTDIPAFGVVLYDSSPNAFTERMLAKHPNLIDYIPSSHLLDDSKTNSIMEQTWERFISSFETVAFSKHLQDSCLSVAEDTIGADALQFKLRLTNNVISELNLTWLEAVALKWMPVLEPVKLNAPSILRPHRHLERLLDLCSFDDSINKSTLQQVLSSEIPLTKKVTFLVNNLDKYRKSGTLEEHLTSLAKDAKPGAPKLIRHLAKHKERIISISVDSHELARTGTHLP